MTHPLNPRCPYCGVSMKKWRNPQLGTWTGEYQFVCFEDRCPYFEKGWAWMLDHFNVVASYRHSVDPVTGAQGPLPVWSPDALKSGVLEEGDS
ncbi:MAG: hypothetical protein HYX76_03275 [Acidobacteria bacterium]|nr:hypothetical protein [Acidobacteriota bacterium]